jgi:adenylate cyclase
MPLNSHQESEKDTPNRAMLTRGLSGLQIGLPLIGVLTVMTLVASVAYYLYEANRSGALLLSNDLVTAIESRVSIEMYSYLQPAQKLAELIDADVDGRPVFEGMAEAEAFARHALITIPSATGVSYADTEGNFLHVRQIDDGSVEDKLIDRRNGGHRVNLTRRKPGGEMISTEEVPTDAFDPRERPWYVDAATAKHPIWTGTYQNLTLHRPTISHVIPHLGKDGKLLTVVSIDIGLDNLCTFLSQLKIGFTGKAYIVDRTGRVIAFPDADWKPASGEGMRAPMLDEIGDPVLARAYDRMRIEGYGRKVLEFGDRRVIVSSEPVKMLAGHDWLVLIVVPESDFIGFVTSSSLIALAISIVIVAIIVGLAGLLGWRNVLAGRRAAMATLRREALEKRTRAIIEVGRRITDKVPDGRDLKTATEAAVDACAAKRAAIWRLSDDGRILSCEDYYDRAEQYHSAGLTIHRDEVPALFGALDEGAVIDTVGHSTDKRAIELAKTNLRRLRFDNIYIAPIMLGGRSIGMLSIEDSQDGERAGGLAEYCDALAILLALKFGIA